MGSRRSRRAGCGAGHLRPPGPSTMTWTRCASSRHRDHRGRRGTQAGRTVRVQHVEFRDFDYRAPSGPLPCRRDAAPRRPGAGRVRSRAAPPEVSDRQFRMDYLAERLRRDTRLSTLRPMPTTCHLSRSAGRPGRHCAPPGESSDGRHGHRACGRAGRMARSAGPRPAAPLIVNVGNFHTLAFRSDEGRFLRLFEHHTGEVTRAAGALADRAGRWNRAP